MSSAEDLFRAAIDAAGLVPPDEIIGDGKLRRFSPSGKRSDDAGWYVFHTDSGVAAGAFGDWRSGESQNWCAKADADMSTAERRAARERIKAAQQAREAETARRRSEAAATALAIWEAAVPAIAHPYLAAKAVKAYGVRLRGGDLLVPMRDTAGKLHSLQTIAPDGTKRFLLGGRVRGCYHAIGRASGSLIVCEGYATGATIHEATKDAVAVAFNAGNLEPVARALRAKYPCLGIVVAADDDWRTEGNPGLTAARSAARTVGGTAAVPNFTGLQRGDHDTDFNDLARLADALEPNFQLSAGSAAGFGR